MSSSTKRVQRNIASAQAHLVRTTGDHSDDVEQVRLALHGLASAQGALEVAVIADAIHADATEQGQSDLLYQARIGHALLGVLCRGADDRASGRGGDLARVRFEGACEEARRHISYAL